LAPLLRARPAHPPRRRAPGPRPLRGQRVRVPGDRPAPLRPGGAAPRRAGAPLARDAAPPALRQPPLERIDVARGGTQLLGDREEPVVLRRPLRAARGAGLDLSRPGGDREVGAERVLGLAPAMGPD